MFRVEGLGFRVRGLGLGFYGLGFGDIVPFLCLVCMFFWVSTLITPT